MITPDLVGGEAETVNGSRDPLELTHDNADAVSAFDTLGLAWHLSRYRRWALSARPRTRQEAYLPPDR